MKKPLNKFALVLGLFAIICAVTVGYDLVGNVMDGVTNIGSSSDKFWSTVSYVFYQTRIMLFGSGVLMGLGVIVELLDRIRWNADHRADQALKL